MSESSTVPGETERWLAVPVPEFEKLYEVSEKGRVRSLDRTLITRAGTRTYSGRLLRPQFRGDGYPCVTLTRPGKRRQYAIHILVLTAFIGPCPEGQETRHGPNGKRDPSLENLCWGTKSENAQDRLRDGTDPRGERHGGVTLTWAMVGEIRARYAAGEQQKSIADSLCVHPASVWSIVHNKSWSYA